MSEQSGECAYAVTRWNELGLAMSSMRHCYGAVDEYLPRIAYGVGVEQHDESAGATVTDELDKLYDELDADLDDEDFPPLPAENDDDGGIRGCVFGGLWGLGVGLLAALALAWRWWAWGGF